MTVPEKDELARTLSALEDALIVAREELEAIKTNDDWFVALRTGRVRSMQSHVRNMLRKVREMRAAAGLEAAEPRFTIVRIDHRAFTDGEGLGPGRTYVRDANGAQVLFVDMDAAIDRMDAVGVEHDRTKKRGEWVSFQVVPLESGRTPERER